MKKNNITPEDNTAEVEQKNKKHSDLGEENSKQTETSSKHR